MAKHRPQYIAGHYYHIYNRGANRQSIFYEEENYKFLLYRLGEYAEKLSISVIAYCLMPNHYHWLVRQDGDEPAGLLPQRVFNSYTKAMNKRYERSGTLFEGTYRSIPVEDDRYLLHLCRYIHANPVKDGLTEFLQLWPFSNYSEWIQARPGKLIDPAFVEAHFPDPARYERFVLDYLATRQLSAELRRHLGFLEG